MNETHRATGSIESKSWEQSDFAGGDGPALAVAKGSDLYRGGIEGEAEWQGLTCTAADGSGSFDSLQRTRCTLGGRTGSFVLRMTGTFEATGDSRADWSVVPGSGTGELAGLAGSGGYESTAGTHTYTLTYHFE
ncbi:DUF3224 domain-containing protein [Nocardia huaxiensis]|uniref:DUF3224 domain-containing protein n=1 Tax=Nocardia huaxiensis TaxID=2755382 RepID=A0A7D6ZFJ5_9NOCA|nr:DUF3224 domain-containing protein [Nocardia huaxiensis]QLY28720.1 DUF3224 domain-containing protein [Nocardia huaxiensis]UFS97805.1 DUF3224 domain-containing protein [Nocardia huaxiensis]